MRIQQLFSYFSGRMILKNATMSFVRLMTHNEKCFSAKLASGTKQLKGKFVNGDILLRRHLSK